DTVRPGDAVSIEGILARNGTRQIWAEGLVFAKTGRKVLVADDRPPIAPRAPRPTPRWPDGTPMLGAPEVQGGYWAYPSRKTRVADGVRVEMNEDGLLAKIADARRVAPSKAWSRGF